MPPAVADDAGDASGFDAAASLSGSISGGPALSGSISPGLHTPRCAVVRSRVLMHRPPGATSRAYGALPPGEVLQLGGPLGATERCPLSKSKRTTHVIGTGPLAGPVEVVVSDDPSPKASDAWAQQGTPKTPRSAGRTALPDAATPAEGEGPRPSRTLEAVPVRHRGGPRRRHPPPSAELREKVKEDLNSLASSRSSEYPKNPRNLRHLLMMLQELCELLNVPITDKSYRVQYNYLMLHAFISAQRGIPEIVGSDLQPSGELPSSGWLPFTIIITLLTREEVPWEFTYNSFTHRICHCATAFPAAVGCVSPAEGSARPCIPSDRKKVVKAWSPTPSPVQLTGGLARSSDASRLEAVRRKEKHFPVRLQELSVDLQHRFLAFADQAPVLLEEFQNLPLASTPGGQQAWERFASNFASEATVLDRCYTQFERLYLGLLHRMMGAALEPVRSMAEPSSTLVRAPCDPFRVVQTAVLCQRLGLLKRRVHFGGRRDLVFFDPQLLAKAQRVAQTETYPVVRDMAEAVLSRFELFCRVLVDLRDDQIDPELATNVELRTAVLELEAAWADCQHVLSQRALDFIGQLLDFVPKLSPALRGQLQVAILAEDEGTCGIVASPEELKEAQRALFETLPILVYLDELWRDISSDKEIEGWSGSFRKLYCQQDDRHHALHASFAKFDESVREQRFAKFRSFILGELTEEPDPLQARYYRNVRAGLLEVAAFPLLPFSAAGSGEDSEGEDSESLENSEERLARNAAAERRDRWVCASRVARRVQPKLFKQERSKSKDKRRKSSSGKTNRLSSLVGATIAMSMAENMRGRSRGETSSRSPAPSHAVTQSTPSPDEAGLIAMEAVGRRVSFPKILAQRALLTSQLGEAALELQQQQAEQSPQSRQSSSRISSRYGHRPASVQSVPRATSVQSIGRSGRQDSVQSRASTSAGIPAHNQPSQPSHPRSQVFGRTTLTVHEPPG